MDRSASTTTTIMNRSPEYDKLQQILDKVREVKLALAGFFIQYEQGQPSWPTILDQMNVLSSQVTTLRALVRNLLPTLRINSIIPMCLSPEVDATVEQLTERRLSVFNHDFMPQLLRTKNLPEIDERERLLNTNSNSSISGSGFGRPMLNPNEIQMRVQELNAALHSTHDILQGTKAATDKTEKQFDLQRFTNPSDTKQLLEAMNYGTALKTPDASTSLTRNEQANLNQQMSNQPQRSQVPSLRIKTVSKANR